MVRLRMAVTVLAGAAIADAAAPGAVAADEIAGVHLPSKVVVDDGLRDDVEELASLSPTLQRQLAAISGAPVRVELRMAAAPPSGSSRAETTLSRSETGYIRAVVVIPAGVDFAELLAHELEHVVEQIEGVNLEALVRSGDAYVTAGGIFETVRARDAGRAAALEVEEGARALKAAH